MTDWDAYALQYDEMAANNAAYQAMLSDFERFVAAELAPGPCRALEIGAGTGHYSARLLDTRPDARVTVLEPSLAMMARASDRLAPSGRADFTAEPLEAFEAEERYDLIICINAPYATADPATSLLRMRGLLSDRGVLYLVDLGKVLNIWDWRLYFLRTLVLRKGPLRALRLIASAGEVSRQNRTIRTLQVSGRYWTHSPSDFTAAIAEAGLAVRRHWVAYRGYCNAAICNAA